MRGQYDVLCETFHPSDVFDSAFNPRGFGSQVPTDCQPGVFRSFARLAGTLSKSSHDVALLRHGSARLPTHFFVGSSVEEKKLPDINPQTQYNIEKELTEESLYKGDGRLGLKGMDDPLDPGPPPDAKQAILKDFAGDEELPKKQDVPNRDMDPEREAGKREGEAETTEERVVGPESATGGTRPKPARPTSTGAVAKKLFSSMLATDHHKKMETKRAKPLLGKGSKLAERHKSLAAPAARRQRAKAILTALEPPAPAPPRTHANPRDVAAKVKAALAAAAEAASSAERRRLGATKRAVHGSVWPSGKRRDSMAKRRVHAWWQATKNHATAGSWRKAAAQAVQQPQRRLLPERGGSVREPSKGLSKENMVAKAAAALQAGRQSVRIAPTSSDGGRHQHVDMFAHQRGGTAFQESEGQQISEDIHNQEADRAANQGKEDQESATEEQDKTMQQVAAAQEKAESLGDQAEATAEKLQAKRMLPNGGEKPKNIDQEQIPGLPKFSTKEERWQKYKDKIQSWVDDSKVKKRNCLPPIRKPVYKFQPPELNLNAKLPICTRATVECNLEVKNGVLVTKGSEDAKSPPGTNASPPGQGEANGGPQAESEEEMEEQGIGTPLFAWSALVPTPQACAFGPNDAHVGGTRFVATRDVGRLRAFL